MGRKIYLITKEYPFGNAERAFIDSEYQLLRREFDIFTVTTEWKGTEEKESLYNQFVLELYPTIYQKLYCFFLFWLKKDAWLEAIRILKDKKKIFKNLMRAAMYGSFAEFFFLRLKRTIGLSRKTEAIFYFYWWDYKCLGLTMHKSKYPGIKIITRTHGYDLYDERELYGRQYFKPQMDRNLARIIFVAQYGKQYYLKKYNKADGEKYPLHRLGVSDPKPDLNCGKGEVFHIISCSNAIPLKRIELIIEGLSKIKDIRIQWTHIGDGSELKNLGRLAKEKLGNNVKYSFLGRIQNGDVISYYKENNVNCFITTTSTEGNPVSVQEALSFGIPIIATRVSDIPYMVDGNGVLLSEDPDGDEIAAAIKTIADMGHDEYIELRKQSYYIYCRDYRADVNHRKFIEELKRI